MTDLLTIDIRDVAFEVNDRLKNLIQPEDDDDITTDTEDRVQGVNTPRFTTRKAESPSAGAGSLAKTSPKLAPKLSPKVAAKMPKPVQSSATVAGVASSSNPTSNAATDAASGQTSQLSPKTGQSSPKTGQKEANVPTSKVILIVSTETPKLRLLSVLGVLIPHMKYTQQETRMESLRWLMWLHQQLPKRVRGSRGGSCGCTSSYPRG